MPRDTYPRDVAVIANRLTAMRDQIKTLEAHLLDVYLLAHEKTTNDGPKVNSTSTGHTQLAANPKAHALWRTLTGRDRTGLPSVRELDLYISALMGDLREVVNVGGHHGGVRPGRPIPQAELDQALVMQRKRRARGDYTPTRQVAQLEEVPKR